MTPIVALAGRWKAAGMTLNRRLLIPFAALAALLLSPAAAGAAWPGTPGKIAFFDREAPGVPLKVFTPDPNGAGGTHVTVRENTYIPPNSENKIPTTGFMAAPAWSPDGTKIAFAAQIDDPGLPDGATHTAIFVWDWKTKTTKQITTPPPGLTVPGVPRVGHQLADASPAWSPDGNSLAYVRFVGAGDADELAGQKGGNVRIVSLTGGGSRQVTTNLRRPDVLRPELGRRPDGSDASRRQPRRRRRG